VRLSDGTEELADVVRRLDGEGIKVADLQLHAPSLDDVFLAKTGRSLEGAGDEQHPEEETGEEHLQGHQPVSGAGAPSPEGPAEATRS
jgi:ABC-2 type transport system ATP-binding protein